MRIEAPLPPLQWRALKSSLWAARRSVVAFLIATLVASACTVAGPLIFAYAIRVLPNRPASVVIWLFIAFAASVALARLLQDARVVLVNRIEQETRCLVSKRILAALMAARGSLFIDNNPSKVSVVVQSLHQSNKMLIQLFMMVVLAGVADIVLSVLAVGGYVSWVVAVFVLVYGVLVVAITVRSNRVTNRYQKAALTETNAGANLLGNILTNIVSIKVFRGQQWVEDLYERSYRNSAISWLRFYRVRLGYGALQAALLFVQYGSIFAALLWLYGAQGKVDQFVLVSMILVQLNRPFELIGSSLRDAIVARGMAEPLHTMLATHAASERDRAMGILPEATRFSVELVGFGFSYAPDRPPVLDRITTVFQPGRINFILGRSGVGKSTLMQVLLGLNEGYTGSVRIGGAELSDLDPNAYLASIGYVPQEPMMMNVSLRENVLLGRNFTDTAVRQALATARLEEKVAALPDGLDFVVGERGQLLSGGERQRVAIARAIIGHPGLLLLDEASSALDEATERSIFAALRDIAEETTIIAITHRVSVIAPNDGVLDLSKPVPQQAVPQLA
jgi:ATP-binding cassette, subfamily B, bacterial